MDDIDDLVYPIIYFCGRDDSDLKWILKMMRFIPENERVKVSNEYMTIFCGDPDSTVKRKEANTFLHGEAKKYRELSFGK